MVKTMFTISVLTESKKSEYFFTEDQYVFIKMVTHLTANEPNASIYTSARPALKGEKLPRVSTFTSLTDFLKRSKE